jgi:hypothetical protein
MTSVAWPSKDPRDYRAREHPARWATWLWSDSGVPYTSHFFAGTCGVFAGLAILDSLPGALACGLLAQAILELTGRERDAD